MILVVDIGNSSIKFGSYEGETLTSRFSIPTKRNANSADLTHAVSDRLSHPVDAAIVCSVMPGIDPEMRDFLSSVLGRDPIFVENSFDFGLKISYEPLGSLGTDRLVNAFAAVEKYGAPCIVCSLGTATTIDVVSGDREFLGGVIAPGLDAMAGALHLKAPRLPEIEISKPERIIGNSTDGSIRSGIYYGYVAMTVGLITRLRGETGVSRVVGTGGNAAILSTELAGILTVDPDLTLNGLRLLAR